MFRKQPKIEVWPTKRDLNILKFGWVLILLHICLVAIFYFNLPEKIPTHFNFKGEINGFGHKSTLWFLLILSAGVYYGISKLINKVKPWKFNYPIKVTEKNAPALYAMNIEMLAVLNLGIALLFLSICAETILQANMVETLVLRWTFTPLTILITVIPFFYIYKMFKIPK